MKARPILRYNRRLDFFGARVDDRLEVSPNGDVWRWSLYPARADRKDEAGTFRITLAAAELQELAALAERVAPEAPGKPSPEGHIEATLEVGDRTIELPDDGPDDQLQLTRRRLDALADRTLTKPLAVVRLAARRSVTQGQPAPVFVLENVGSRRVSVLTPAANFSVLAVRPQGNRLIFRGEASATAGYFDADGEMIDGLLRPAVLEPNGSATLVFSQPVDTAGAAQLLATVEGKISLTGPIARDEFPDAAFKMSTYMS